MRRRYILINGMLALALVGAGAASVLAVGNPSPTTTSATPTAIVSRGTLTSTVSASGNLSAKTTVGVSFPANSGTVTAIEVKVGQAVAADDALATSDDTSARQTLASAQAGLASARAQLTTTTEKQTSQEAASSQAQVRSTQVNLTNAQAALSQAEATDAQDKSTQDALVAAAQATYDATDPSAVTNAKTALSQARATYAQDKVTQNGLVAAAQAAYDAATDPTAKANAKSALTQAKNTRASTLLRDSQSIQTARGNLASAEASTSTTRRNAKSALTQAKKTRSSTLLRDSQSIQTARGNLTAAQASLSSTKASTAVNAQGPGAGAIASAEAQIASAQAQVDQAQTALDRTTLRAPVAGTVVSIAGTVGGPSSAGTSSSTSSSTSGFVVLSSLSDLQVTTMVAEADAAKVALGQPATISFSALNENTPGTVTAMDIVSTVSNNVVEYGVTVSLTKPPSGLRLGQTASVSITVGTKAGVLSVPSSAITKVGPLTTVTVRRDGKDTATPVQTGLVGDSGTEITSGLSEGDVVVLSASSGVPGGFTFPGGGFPGAIPGGLGQ